MQKDLSIVQILLMSALFYRNDNFLGNQEFSEVCSNLMEKFFLEVLNDKSNVAQDFESIYIDSNFYIGKKD